VGVPIYLVGSVALLILTGMTVVLTHYFKAKDGAHK